jgi:hypothetical protein
VSSALPFVNSTAEVSCGALGTFQRMYLNCLRYRAALTNPRLPSFTVELRLLCQSRDLTVEFRESAPEIIDRSITPYSTQAKDWTGDPAINKLAIRCLLVALSESRILPTTFPRSRQIWTTGLFPRSNSITASNLKSELYVWRFWLMLIPHYNTLGTSSQL